MANGGQGRSGTLRQRIESHSGSRVTDADPTNLDLFDAGYYATDCGRPYQRRSEWWLEFFGAIADRIISDIAPTTVLDAGCAMGFLVEALRARGFRRLVWTFLSMRLKMSIPPFDPTVGLAQ